MVMVHTGMMRIPLHYIMWSLARVTEYIGDD